MKERLKPKTIISANHAINWYSGNYLENPNNALREDEALMEKAFEELEIFRSKLKETKLTHREFLDFIKVVGFHEKYYHYQKPKSDDCIVCKHLGIRI